MTELDKIKELDISIQQACLDHLDAIRKTIKEKNFTPEGGFVTADGKKLLDVTVTEGKRNIYYQAGLWSIGREYDRGMRQWRIIKDDDVVTWTLESKHLEGKAYDLGCIVKVLGLCWPNPEREPNRKIWLTFAELGKKCGLKPGAYFTHRPPDYPHFEIA